MIVHAVSVLTVSRGTDKNHCDFQLVQQPVTTKMSLIYFQNPLSFIAQDRPSEFFPFRVGPPGDVFMFAVVVYVSHFPPVWL